MLGKLVKDLKLRYYVESHLNSEGNWFSKPYMFLLDFIIGIYRGLALMACFGVVMAFVWGFYMLMAKGAIISILLYVLITFGLMHAFGSR